MKLSAKLPLVFASLLCLVAAAALAGIHELNRALTQYQTVVAVSHDHEIAVADLAGAFKVQVQEWKNALLRGKNGKALFIYWGAFVKQERIVAEKTRALQTMLPEGGGKSFVDKFAQAHARMGVDYRKGLEAFKTAGYNPELGDAAVKGIDREPVELLDHAARAIASDAAATAAQAAAQARRATQLSVSAMILACVVGVVTGGLFSRRIVRQLGGEPDTAADLARLVAQGDLSVPLGVRRGDTTSLIARLAEMQVSLRRVVESVRNNSESVAAAAAEIASGNQELSQRTEEQASALEETAASMEQLGATVRQNADNARQANQFVLSASSVAVKGGEVVSQAVATMKGINDSSKKIADIVGIIDGIAFQTNILALNAAVEAARAGEQGRGFAVVATEVRSLAGRSADAAREIKRLISASAERVEQGSALVDQAGVTMTEVVAAIRRVTDLMSEISAASTEQSAGVFQVGEAVGQMDRVTQKNAALVEESAAAADRLKLQAQQLVQTVAVFKLAPLEASSPAKAMTDAVFAPAERRGPTRAKTLARPASGHGTPVADTATSPRPTEPARVPVDARTGTADWTSF